MEAILEHERTTTRKLERAAKAAWAATLLVPFAGGFFLLTPARGGGGVLAVAMLLGTVGAFGFVAAVLLTIGWLFRSRVSTMAAIEMRLASLEDLIERASERRNDG